MIRLSQSLLEATWALSLLGVREAGLVAASPVSARAARAAGEAMDAVTWRAREELGTALGEVFQAGDSLQRGAVDLAWDSLPQDLLAPGAWLAAGTGVAEAAGSTAVRFLVPGRDAGLAWRELGNKLEVYRLVKRVREELAIPPPGEPFDVPTLVGRAYKMGEYPALWAVEGLGHDWALHEWQEAGRPPRDLLSGPAGRTLPPESLAMLHAGIGLGFAERLLAGLPREPTDEAVRATVARIVALCRENSRPGYAGAALESMGLVARTYHEPLVPRLDRALLASDPTAREYFWHGLGRALYFLPINIVPCGRVTWRPFEMGDQAAPDPSARRNVRAGLGWAFCLVNMRQPAIVSRLLLAHHGEELADDDAFSNGVASAVMVRQDTTPCGRLVETFLGFPAGGPGAPWWDPLVRRPSERALWRVYPGLLRSGTLGEAFRYQDLAALEAAAGGGGLRP